MAKNYFAALLLTLSFTLAAQEKPVTDSAASSQYITLARSHIYNEPLLGKKYARLAIHHGALAGSPRLEGAGYNNLGLAYRNLSQYDSAIAAFDKAVALFRRGGVKSGVGNARNNMAMTYFYRGEYEKSNTMLMEVIHDAEKHNLYPVLSNAYQNLGIMNDSQERYRDALENFKLAEKYHSLAGDDRAKSGAAINQAFMYYKLKQFEKALAIYKQQLPVKEKLNDHKGMGIIYNNIAEIYLLKKNYPLALQNIDNAIAIKTRLDDRHGLSGSYRVLAEIYLWDKKYTEAEKYAALSANIAKEIGAKKELAEALRVASKIHEATKRIDDAYTSLAESVKIKDSLLNKDNFARMAELETKYKTASKEREILSQRAEIAESQVQIGRQKIIIYGVVIGTLALTLLGYALYNKQKIKALKLQKAAELKDALLLIETQNKLQQQRLQISRDLHDNIGSQLTFIISSLDNLKYGFSITDEGLKNRLAGIRFFTKETITELRDTIWAMNKEAITVADLKNRISNFIDTAKAASRGITFNFYIDEQIPDTLAFSSLAGINLYRVIQESVNNALKHAGATSIAVSIRKEAGGYGIAIRDNGNGFDTAAERTGNGLDNIRKRIAETGGTVAITSAGTGTTVHISLK
ncbi:MAG: tetratricopeptide repeat-containing sensor histidine kinase [Flavobacterium sp.]